MSLSSNSMKEDLRNEYVKIFLVESLYWVVSIGAVFTNDFVLTDTLLTEDLTVFVTFFQVTFSLVLIITLNKINKRYFLDHDSRQESLLPSTNDNDGQCSSDSEEEILFDIINLNRSVQPATQRPQQQHKQSNIDGLSQVFVVNIPHRIDLETCKVIFPLSILYTGMLLLNNYCLKNVGVAFYFVSRSLTTVFNVIFTYFLIDNNVSKGTIICCAMIIMGFLLGIDQESVFGSLSVMGIGFGISSSLFTSLFSIFTKKKLERVDNNIWVLIMYNNINAILITIPLLLIHGDIQGLIDEKIVSPSFWIVLSISGVMAFLISMVTNASIKFTSPLSHNISGTAKSCVQTILAVFCTGEIKSILWWLSNLIILIASAVYSRLRQLEMERLSGLILLCTDDGTIDEDEEVPPTKSIERQDIEQCKLNNSESDRHTTIKFKLLSSSPA